MRKSFLIGIMLLTSIPFFAQQVNINGKVIEKSSNSPLGFVSVALFKGETLIKGTNTLDNGSFAIANITPGAYNLRFSFVGYTTINKKMNISGKNSNINLEPIQLSADTKILKEIEVVTQGSQVKFDIDKKVFSVDQSIAAAGGNATEVLQNIPSVNVDNDGNISLRNNSNVEIWINGKPSGLTDENRAQILEQMPAGSIESVEVTTNPSAKYSPEGSAGIINLVMKKERKAGYWGSVNGGLSYPVGAKKVGEIGGGNLNFNVGKFDGYVNLGIRNTYSGSKTEVDRYYLNNSDTLYSLLQKSTSDNQMYGTMNRYGLNFTPNKRHSFGISGFFLIGERDGESDLHYLKESSTIPKADYNRINNSETNRNMTNTVLDHTYTYDAKTELRSSLSYSTFNNYSDGLYIQTVNSGAASSLNQIQNTDSHNTTLELKSDLTKKFGEKQKLESGIDIKAQNRLSTSDGSNYDGSSYQEVPYMYNKFRYKEQLYALYGTYGFQVNKLSIQTGLRGEYLYADFETNDVKTGTKEYLQLFPTVFLSYSLPSKNEIQFNYTRRVNRPRGRQLSSFKDVSDSTNISYGNPNLDPEFTSSFELNHIKTWEKHTLSTSLYYKFTDNVIQSVRFLDTNGLLNSTYMNVSQSQSSGLELVSKDDFTKFLSVTSTLNVYYYSLLASDFKVSPTQNIHVAGDEDFSWNLRIMTNFMLSKTLSGQITGNYTSPKVITQGTVDEQYSIDLGLRKSFFNRKLNAALSVRDIFNTRRNINTSYSDNFIQYYNAKSYTPDIRLTVNYNFGKNNKKKQQKEKEDDNNDDNLEDF